MQLQYGRVNCGQTSIIVKLLQGSNLMKNSLRLPAALLLSLFLFGCGQSGPLYVSGNPSTVEPPSGQSDSEEENEQDGQSADAE